MSNHEEKVLSESTTTKPTKNSRTVPLWILVAIIVILIATGCAWRFMHSPRNYYNQGVMPMYNQSQGGKTHRGYTMRGNFDENPRYHGVVTSVDGDTFKLSGNGESLIVKATGSTTYNNTDKKVSINDSVVVFGTKSDNIISATSVRIMNR